MRLQPTGDRVIILPDPAETTTPGGLTIPATATERPQSGTILEVGERQTAEGEILERLATIEALVANKLLNYEKPMLYKKGMRVLYGRYAGTEISYMDKEYLIMRTGDIIGIIVED